MKQVTAPAGTATDLLEQGPSRYQPTLPLRQLLKLDDGSIRSRGGSPNRARDTLLPKFCPVASASRSRDDVA